MPVLQLVKSDQSVEELAGDGSGRAKVVMGEGNAGGIFTLQKTVTTAGTAVQLTSQAVREGCQAIIKARRINAGYIYISDTQAHAQDHAIAYELSADQAVGLKLANLNEAWIDASVNGEGVECIGEK